MACDIPLTEFDAESAALIEPRPGSVSGEIPEHAVICFFRDVIEQVCGDGRAEVVATFAGEYGRCELFSLKVGDRRVGVFHPGLGAPLSCGIFEEVIATGCSKFVACGGAGAVVPGLALGHVVVPDAAVRDEGTSYHYLPPSREVRADPTAVGVLSAVLDEAGVPYVVGKTWTTDAFYRETQVKIAARRGEGCITVEMEGAAFLAVARHRGVSFAQYLYAGDDVSGETWTTGTGIPPQPASTCSGCPLRPFCGSSRWPKMVNLSDARSVYVVPAIARRAGLHRCRQR